MGCLRCEGAGLRYVWACLRSEEVGGCGPEVRVGGAEARVGVPEVWGVLEVRAAMSEV